MAKQPAKPAKRKVGRPKIEFDYEKTKSMAAIGCTLNEIAAINNVGLSTVEKRMQTDPEFARAIKEGREGGKSTLRRMQWQLAEQGHPTMLIWLGKQMLGQTDKRVQAHYVESAQSPEQAKDVVFQTIFKDAEALEAADKLAERMEALSKTLVIEGKLEEKD